MSCDEVSSIYEISPGCSRWGRFLHPETNNLDLPGGLEGKRVVPIWGNHREGLRLRRTGLLHLERGGSKAHPKCWTPETTARIHIRQMKRNGL